MKSKKIIKTLLVALVIPLEVSARRFYPINDPQLEAFNVKAGLILFCGFILLLILALIVDGIKMIQSKINKKHPKPYNLDKGEYAFLSYVDSKCFKESGEQPRSTYRSIDKCTKDSIYVKVRHPHCNLMDILRCSLYSHSYSQKPSPFS